jgi:hypothetical protein
MAQIIKLKRSLTPNSKPTTSDLAIGELAMNVTDGKVFLRKSGSAGDNIKEIVTLDHDGTLSGSLNITGSITASAFVGDGSRLTNITVSQNATVKSTFTNSISWSIEHNLDTPNAIIQAYNSDNYQLIPENIKMVNDDNILITFSTPQSGFAVVAKGGHIVSGSVSAGDVSGLGDLVIDEINQAGVFSGSVQVSLSGDVTGTAAATVIGTVDGAEF